ncbi:WGxxGxxG family protein [Streptomyces sp. NPDC051041]|uniref:WGxxGxxG family protein n=1 Tax=Streptomyces sp. NPDC051041 TaxID=3365640 RepID=UPI0037BC4699
MIGSPGRPICAICGQAWANNVNPASGDFSLLLELRDSPASRDMGARPRPWVIQGGTMRRMPIGALLAAALLAGPAAVTAEAQAPVMPHAATAQVSQSQAQDDNNDDDDGGWGLWGLAGLLGLLGLIPRRRKTPDTGTHRGTGAGGPYSQ